jgi:hypothetical protein
VGKVVQPLQSVNCYDSYAHGHEQHEPFTRLVGIWLGWICQVRVYTTGNNIFSSCFLNSSVLRNITHISSLILKPTNIIGTEEYRPVCPLVN